ncbi:hypothetical protein RF11_04954 [Thelohanellus kitauei]|uniref:Uncharacterized protein n=1 Tax=Thelohanellus kitauei TaxID=669202 RepID=A0A0C2M8H8_THEKT|nr:hypothetical protein RF11_04954 [Thelohanellus kitauei]
MEFKNNFENEENNKVINYYVDVMKSNHLPNMMEAVGKFILWFNHQYDPYADHLFVTYFPVEIFEELNETNECLTKSQSFQTKKNLLMDSFAFIFRNLNSLKESNAQSVVKIFLKVIQSRNTNSESDLHHFILFEPIIICVSYQPNKIFFIDENGVFNFYQHFNMSKIKNARNFWKICDQIYSLKHSGSSLFSCIKLKNHINQIMKSYLDTKNDDYAKLLLRILTMICQLRMLDEIQLNINKFYEISTCIFLRYGKKISCPLFFVTLSKIWIIILKNPRNTFQINTMNKLIFLAGIFSFDLSTNLKKDLKKIGTFLLTQNNKKRLYVIHLALIAFPMIDHKNYVWLREVLKRLHESFQMYIKTEPIKLFTIENQYFIFQYYIKSIVTLNMIVNRYDEIEINRFFRDLQLYPSLSKFYLLTELHYSYLYSHMLNVDRDISTFSEFNKGIGLGKIKRFLNDLVMAISDETYINKLKHEQKLCLYEDTHSHISFIQDDLIKIVFSKCDLLLIADFKSRPSDVSETIIYKTCNQLMSWIVHSLNDSNYLDPNTTEFYLRKCKVLPYNTSNIRRYPETFQSMTHSKLVSDLYEQNNMKNRTLFPNLLKWIALIYELKFIFGDINSKFTALNFS